MNREEAERALASNDWSGATVERESRPVSVVHSVRLPAELSARLEAEAGRRDVTPGALIRDLIDMGLMPLGADVVVTVRLADLHRAIDTAVKHAA
jgi:hypothetical protein